ncbi:unnamed protein product [Parajaminaea phylloscopi]
MLCRARVTAGLAGRARWGVSAASLPSRRHLATPVPPGQVSGASKSDKPADPYASSPWRHPLASAQTLSLFSTSPPALLFALEQSLQGALTAVAKVGTRVDDYVLAFAVDKTLPSDVLAEATRLLRDVPIAHVGVLSDPLPNSWLPNTVVGDSPASGPASLAISTQSYHTISLSLLPGSLAQPFHSTIPGAPEVKAGRWATGKPSFDESSSRVQNLASSRDAEGGTGGTGGTEGEIGWRQVWGRENASGTLPSEFTEVTPESHLLTMVLGSDKAPQGLLEGLDAKYGDETASAGSSSLMGAYASNTFFETGGRDRCMFFRQSASDKSGKIVQDGAVGLVLSLPKAAGKSSTEPIGAKPRLSLTTPWRDLITLGSRRRVTRAKGNIVSELDESNACQWFLRDVASRKKAGRSEESVEAAKAAVDSQASRKPMDAATQRLLSDSVEKEEEFWAAIWQSKTAAADKGETPLLLTRILSGHPGRGTISLDTDLDLSSKSSAASELYVSFHQYAPEQSTDGPEKSTNSGRESATDAGKAIIELPGPDMGAWALPRFLFVSTPEPVAAREGTSSAKTSTDTKAKPQVHALPNLFVLPSSGGGLLQRQSPKQQDAAGAASTSLGLSARTTTWRLPASRLLVDLRGK